MEGDLKGDRGRDPKIINRDTIWERNIQLKLPNNLESLEDLKKTNTEFQKDAYEFLLCCERISSWRGTLINGFGQPNDLYELIEEFHHNQNFIFPGRVPEILDLIDFDKTSFGRYQSELDHLYNEIERGLDWSLFEMFQESKFLKGLMSLLRETIDKINILFYHILHKIEYAIIHRPSWCSHDLDYKMYKNFLQGKESKTFYGLKDSRTAKFRIDKSILRLRSEFKEELSGSLLCTKDIKNMQKYLEIVSVQFDSQGYCYINEKLTEKMRSDFLKRILGAGGGGGTTPETIPKLNSSPPPPA